MILNLKIFLDILMFTRGPQDLPSTSNFLTTIILINIIVGLISVDPNISYTINIFFAVIYIVVTLLFIKICLGIQDNNKGTQNLFSSRRIQVSSGILGIHALIATFTGIISISGIVDENSIIFILLFLNNPQITVYHKYYDPMLIIFFFCLFSFKINVDKLSKFRNIVFLYLYFLIFLIINLLKFKL